MDDTTPATVLAWIDVETTGLDAAADQLLEVACILTDTNLVQLAKPYQAVVRHENPASLRTRVDEVVRDMHDRTGLWDRLPGGTPLEQVDADLLAYISAVAPQPRQARVAGNSIRLDLNFLEAKLPRSYRHLHYRSVDVSAVALLAREWWQVPTVGKQMDHSALADIRESLEELRRLRREIHSAALLSA